MSKRRVGRFIVHVSHTTVQRVTTITSYNMVPGKISLQTSRTYVLTSEMAST